MSQESNLNACMLPLEAFHNAEIESEIMIACMAIDHRGRLTQNQIVKVRVHEVRGVFVLENVGIEPTH